MEKLRLYTQSKTEEVGHFQQFEKKSKILLSNETKKSRTIREKRPSMSPAKDLLVR